MWIVLALLAAICATFIVLLSKAGLRNVSPNLAFATGFRFAFGRHLGWRLGWPGCRACWVKVAVG